MFTAEEQHECHNIVMRMKEDFYGNGKPGVLKEVREINSAIIGDMNNDGMATDMRVLKEEFSRFKAKPRDNMLRIKDIFYITLAIISIAGFIITFIRG